MPAPPTLPPADDDLSESEWEDIIAALRIAASSVEQAAQLARPDPAELPPRLADKAKVALRRTAARYRKLASRL